MATFVLTGATIWLHDQDLSSYTNQVSLTPEVDAQDSTTFGSSGYRERKAGLRSVEAAVQGFWESTPDTQIFADLGVIDRAMTVTPDGAEGSKAFLFQTGNFKYESFGSVGEMAPFSLTTMNTNSVGLVRGLLGKAKGTVSATGALGSAINVGAGGASKYLYAAFHVFSAGTTITVQVQSDDAQGFGTPTTVATIGPLTAVGGTFMTRVDASAITDTWWRFNVSAITGTFTVAGSIAVQ